jgi:geranylgeranyl pyrophosphate synthase
VQTCGLAWRQALHCMPGKSSKKWARSFRGSSNRMAMWKWYVISTLLDWSLPSSLQARDYVRRSSGIERTRDLARTHADKAKQVIQVLPDSDAKVALEIMTEKVAKRTH